MALNIKNVEVEKLAAEVAELAGESKTEAIKQALRERGRRLRMHSGGMSREDRLNALLARIRKDYPRGDFGRVMTKAEKEAILGYGPEGV